MICPYVLMQPIERVDYCKRVYRPLKNRMGFFQRRKIFQFFFTISDPVVRFLEDDFNNVSIQNREVASNYPTFFSCTGLNNVQRVLKRTFDRIFLD